MSSKRADGSWMLTEICNFYLISGARLAPTGLISNQNYILPITQVSPVSLDTEDKVN